MLARLKLRLLLLVPHRKAQEQERRNWVAVIAGAMVGLPMWVRTGTAIALAISLGTSGSSAHALLRLAGGGPDLSAGGVLHRGPTAAPVEDGWAGTPASTASAFSVTADWTQLLGVTGLGSELATQAMELGNGVCAPAEQTGRAYVPQSQRASAPSPGDEGGGMVSFVGMENEGEAAVWADGAERPGSDGVVDEDSTPDDAMGYALRTQLLAEERREKRRAADAHAPVIRDSSHGVARRVSVAGMTRGEDGADGTCPVSTGGGTRRVQLVREGGGGADGLRGKRPGRTPAGDASKRVRVATT